MSQERYTAVGAFARREQAGAAVQALLAAGFRPDQIGVAFPDAAAGAAAPGRPQTRAAAGAAAGAATGGAAGALAGAVVAGLVPGVAPLVATTALAGVLGGSAAGAAAGGVLGALLGAGVAEADARYYDREFAAGRVVVAVRAGGRAAEAATVLLNSGAYRATAAAT
jgi:hypothetical protein